MKCPYTPWTDVVLSVGEHKSSAQEPGDSQRVFLGGKKRLFVSPSDLHEKGDVIIIDQGVE